MEDELIEALEAALDYIDALPANVVASLPPMPGFCRDDVDMLIYRAKYRTDENFD